MRLSDYEILTFDCYGTLIDWESGIVAELRNWAQRNGAFPSDGQLLEVFAGFESKHQSLTPEAPYPEVLAAVFMDLAGHWGIAASRDEARTFGQSVERWPAFADSPAALAYLKRHFKLGILSNVDRASFALSNAKLAVKFDKIVTAQDVGSYKPDPRNFERLLAELAEMGIAAEAVLHVAQSLFHDIAPAGRLGLKTVWVNRRKGKDGWGATPPPPEPIHPDLEVASLQELAELHRAEQGAA